LAWICVFRVICGSIFLLAATLARKTAALCSEIPARTMVPARPPLRGWCSDRRKSAPYRHITALLDGNVPTRIAGHDVMP
jgi:hypothetical protein